MNKITKIFLVDDDAVFIKLLAIEFLQSNVFEVLTFATGELCIKSLDQLPDVIILDYHLDGVDKNAINGLETLMMIKEYNSGIPVIMLSSQDSIDIAVQCMRHKAYDYVVKSETSFLRLQKIINTFFILQDMENRVTWYRDRM